MTESQTPLRAGSIDPKEVAFYDALAETWWDTSGRMWPLHRLNKLRVRYLRDQLQTAFPEHGNPPLPLQGLRILDVGCGGGLLCEPLAQLGATVTGIDVVERNILIARRHLANQRSLNIEYEVQTAEALRDSGARFDVVLSMEVVEHVIDLPNFVGACADLVRPGGLIGFATINKTLLSYLTAIIGAEYVLRWLPRGTHQWRKFVRPETLERLLSAKGFTITDRRGVAINPFNRRFRLTSNLAVNYMLTARREHR